jgi:hypothetical protein
MCIRNCCGTGGRSRRPTYSPATGQRRPVPLPVAGLYPSLHLNLAECYRKIGGLGRARGHLHHARAGMSALGDEDYEELIRDCPERLTQQLIDRRP